MSKSATGRHGTQALPFRLRCARACNIICRSCQSAFVPLAVLATCLCLLLRSCIIAHRLFLANSIPISRTLRTDIFYLSSVQYQWFESTTLLCRRR